ncbi:MAG: M56 family metallopeptidase [Prevotella sp.]|nr:M56 family metallopeptidase [Prevotella sp.]
MTDFLIYDAKVAVLIVVFYMFYRLLLSKETFHRVNRMVLLSTALLSFVLPLCVITTHQTVVLDAVPAVSVGALHPMVQEEDSTASLWQTAIPILYIIGVVTMLGHTLLSVWRVMMLVRRSERYPQADGTTLCVVNDDVPPFSFCSFIVMNHSDYEAHEAAVLAHERGHIRQHHSCDVLLVDLLTALQWFNPAMWMLRADLRAIHEYEADGAVLSQGINARQYQYLLITKAASIGGYSIANGISHSTLKNRITMMLHKKSPRSSFMKLLALIPIVGVALALNAETVNDYVYQQPPKKIVKKGNKSATAKMGNNTIEIIPDTASNARIDNPEVGVQKEVKDVFVPVEQNPEFFDVVEQMPEYPGGPSALFEYLAKNIRYPESAEKAGIQGRVIATFVVMKDGSISNVKVVKSVSPELDTEALRVLSSMPNWTPGMQNGKAVNVKYTVPISFALPDSKIEETKESSVVVVKMK